MLRPTLCALLMLSCTWTQAEDLMEVYQAALENDATLRVARANRDAIRLSEPLAGSLLLPSVSVTGRAAGTASDGNTGDYTSASAGISLTQALYRRDYTLQRDQAREQVQQADADYTAQEQALVLRVANAYFDVLSATDNLGFVRAQNAAIDRQLDQAKQRFDVGLIAITAVHEAQARSDQARADLILAENDLDNAREALREIVSQDLGELAGLGKVPLEAPTPDSLEKWSEMALENSPELESARRSVEIARQEIELQRSARLPKVDLEAGHDFTAYGGDLDGEQNDTRIGVRLSLPIWLGGSIGISTDRASLRFDQAQEDLERQRRGIERQVRDAFRTAVASISAVRALEAGIVSASSALEATEAGFEVGTRTIVDVLNAERDLYDVRSKHASARYRYVLAGLQLKQAAGVLSEEDIRQVNGWLK